MTIRVKMMITVDIDTEEYTVPADGKVNTEIEEFVREACKVANISTAKIKSKKSNLRPNDIQVIKGNYNKAKKLLRWKPKTKFKDLVRIMVEEDIKRWKKFLDKEPQPWDLIQY